METDTLKRFDRLVAILIQLQSKKIVKSQEMAERFGVSQRTIYRDLQTLEKAGVPLYGEAGMGYSLVEGYRLPPVMFTREEAGSFLTAEKLMAHFTDKSLGKHFESALLKIKSVLRGAEKDWLSALDNHITVNKTQSVFNESVPNALELLFESLTEKKQIILNYRPVYAEKPESRAIEPVGLFYENQFWYILGFCHLRKDYRQFRLDRIHGIEKSEEPFTRQHRTVEEYREQKKQKKKWTEVTLLAEKKVSRYLESGFQYFQIVSKKIEEKQVHYTFKVDIADPGFVRWLLMFGDYIQILTPTSLKQQAREILTRALARLNNAE